MFIPTEPQSRTSSASKTDSSLLPIPNIFKSPSLIDYQEKGKKMYKKPPIKPFQNHQLDSKGKITFFFTYIQNLHSQPPFAGSEDHVWKNFGGNAFLFFLIFFGKWFVTIELELQPPAAPPPLYFYFYFYFFPPSLSPSCF